MSAGALTTTAPPLTVCARVWRAAPLSFGRDYVSLGLSTSSNRNILGVGEDSSGNSGKANVYAGDSSNLNQVFGPVLSNSTWHSMTGVIASGVSRTIYLDGSAGVTGANSINPIASPDITIIGQRPNLTTTAAANIAHVAMFKRALAAIEVSYYNGGGNPRPLVPYSYWKVDQPSAGTEVDQMGHLNLAVTGTANSTATPADPDQATYWTAAAFGNQAYVQGTPIATTNLTTKFDDVHSVYASTLQQLSAGSAVTTANGASIGTSNQLTCASAAAFSAGDYVSVNTTAPMLVLSVVNNTLLLSAFVSWANGDSISRYSVSARTFTGLSITTNSWAGTPVGGDVGTYNNCFFRAACSGNAALIADSPVFNITIASSGAAPSFTAGPVITITATDGWTAGATCSQTATWHRGAYLRGSPTPSGANVIAGAGTGFVAHASVALTINVPGTLQVSGLTLPLYDVYDVVTNGSGTSAVAATTSLFKAPPAGFQYISAAIPNISAITRANPCRVTANNHTVPATGGWVELFGVGGMTQVNGLFVHATYVDANNVTLDGVDSSAFTVYTTGGTLTYGQSVAKDATTRIVTGDVFIFSAATSPDGEVLTPTAQGAPIALANSLLPRQNYTADAYSVSLGAVIGAVTEYANDLVPSPPSTNPPLVINLALNQNTSTNIGVLATDSQGDTLSVAALTALPSGLTMSGVSMIGIPTVSGVTTVTFQWTNNAGDTATADIAVAVGKILEPDATGLSFADAFQLLAAVQLVGNNAGSQPDPNPAGPAAVGIVFSQSPPIGTPLNAGDSVFLTLSDGTSPGPPTPPVVGTRKANLILSRAAVGDTSSAVGTRLNGAFTSTDVCAASGLDPAGTIYVFPDIPSHARILDVLLLNDANPGVTSPSSFKGGVFLLGASGVVVNGSDSILFPAGLSIDAARPVWTSVFSPSIAGALHPSIANVNLYLWQLLGFSAPPSPQVTYSVGLTSLNPGGQGGNIGLRIVYTL